MLQLVGRIEEELREAEGLQPVRDVALTWSASRRRPAHAVVPTSFILRAMQPPSDQGKRGHLAVAISIVEEEDAYVLFLDDLHLRDTTEGWTWEHKKFVTTAVVSKEKLQTMNFSMDEMAGMGRTILGSLRAMYATEKRE